MKSKNRQTTIVPKLQKSEKFEKILASMKLLAIVYRNTYSSQKKRGWELCLKK
jgi:hypothetical protein